MSSSSRSNLNVKPYEAISAFYLYLVPVSLSDVFIAGENLEILNNFRRRLRFLPMPDPSELHCDTRAESLEDGTCRCPSRSGLT